MRVFSDQPHTIWSMNCQSKPLHLIFIAKSIYARTVSSDASRYFHTSVQQVRMLAPSYRIQGPISCCISWHCGAKQPLPLDHLSFLVNLLWVSCKTSSLKQSLSCCSYIVCGLNSRNLTSSFEGTQAHTWEPCFQTHSVNIDSTL